MIKILKLTIGRIEPSRNLHRKTASFCPVLFHFQNLPHRNLKKAKSAKSNYFNKNAIVTTFGVFAYCIRSSEIGEKYLHPLKIAYCHNRSHLHKREFKLDCIPLTA